MKKYRMVITNGKNTAPAMVINAEKPEVAEKIARERSSLSRFKSWTFIAVEI